MLFIYKMNGWNDMTYLKDDVCIHMSVYTHVCMCMYV